MDIDEEEDLGQHRDTYMPLMPQEPAGYADAARRIKSEPLDPPQLAGWSCTVTLHGLSTLGLMECLRVHFQSKLSGSMPYTVHWRTQEVREGQGQEEHQGQSQE